MNTYKFPTYPSSSSTVASGVTVLVSVWFLVAAAAILSDPPSPYTHKEIVATTPVKNAHVEVTLRSVALAPQALGTIYVSARRSAT